jgi:hypothetical protein
MNLLPRNLSRICDRTSTRMETMRFQGRSENQPEMAKARQERPGEPGLEEVTQP